MSGNVREWTGTLYHDYPYRPDGGLEDVSASGRRVLRGGSWDVDLISARSAFRRGLFPALWLANLGFRVVIAYRPSP